MNCGTNCAGDCTCNMTGEEMQDAFEAERPRCAECGTADEVLVEVPEGSRRYLCLACNVFDPDLPEDADAT